MPWLPTRSRLPARRPLKPFCFVQNPPGVGQHYLGHSLREVLVNSVIGVRPPGSALVQHVPETLQRQRIQVVGEGLDESGVYAAAFGKRKAGVLSYRTAAVERGVIASARGVSPVDLRLCRDQALRQRRAELQALPPSVMDPVKTAMNLSPGSAIRSVRAVTSSARRSFISDATAGGAAISRS